MLTGVIDYILPDEIGPQLLAVVDEQVLAGHAAVHAGQKPAQVRDFLRLRPAVEKGLVETLFHEVRRFQDMPVELRPDAARGNAVAGRAVLGDAERHILHIGDDAALAGGIAGKFGSVGGAGGSHENNGPDGRRQTVFFRHCNGPLEIDPDLIAPLLNTTPSISGSSPVISAI